MLTPAAAALTSGSGAAAGLSTAYPQILQAAAVRTVSTVQYFPSAPGGAPGHAAGAGGGGSNAAQLQSLRQHAVRPSLPFSAKRLSGVR